MITSPAEYDFIESAERAHRDAGLLFSTAFDHYFCHGWIQKTPLGFIMAGHHPDRPDAWLVWWAEMHPNIRGDHRIMLRQFLRLMPYRKPYVAFARTLKGNRTVRFYSTARLFALTRK